MTECIAEAKSTNKSIFLITQDAQKAFDVVDHNLLLHKLFHDRIKGSDWCLLKDLYTNLTTRVIWKGGLSEPFTVLQGVRQGGVLSSSHSICFLYKLIWLKYIFYVVTYSNELKAILNSTFSRHLCWIPCSAELK